MISQLTQSQLTQGALGRSFILEQRQSGLPRLLLVFDAITSEVPEFEADVTLLPTESGTEVTDHIQIRNPILKMDGVISESPIDMEVTAANIAGANLDSVTPGQLRNNFRDAATQSVGGIVGGNLLGTAASGLPGAGLVDVIARNALLDLYSRRARFTVVTRRQQYTNMVIQKMSFPKTSDTGRQLQFSITFQQVRIVAPFTVNIESVASDTANSATTEASQGSQTSRAATASEAMSVMDSVRGSVLFQGGSFLGIF